MARRRRTLPLALAVAVVLSLTLDVDAVLDATNSSAPSFGMRVRASSDEDTEIRYDRASHVRTLDTRRSGYGTPGVYQATVHPDGNGRLPLRVVQDRSSVEVFAGDGQSLTARIYPRYAESTAAQLFADGGELRVPQLRAWRLGSSWSG